MGWLVGWLVFTTIAPKKSEILNSYLILALPSKLAYLLSSFFSSFLFFFLPSFFLIFPSCQTFNENLLCAKHNETYQGYSNGEHSPWPRGSFSLICISEDRLSYAEVNKYTLKHQWLSTAEFHFSLLQSPMAYWPRSPRPVRLLSIQWHRDSGSLRIGTPPSHTWLPGPQERKNKHGGGTLVFQGLGANWLISPTYRALAWSGHMPQPNSRGGWEMWGVHGFLLSIKYQCDTSKDTDKQTIISTQCVGGSDPGMHRAPRKHRWRTFTSA